jgi:hypothetical protein
MTVVTVWAELDDDPALRAVATITAIPGIRAHAR